LEYDRIFSGHMTHTLVECPSKQLNVSMNSTDILDESEWAENSTHHEAVCMPYYGFRGTKSLLKYNGATRKVRFDETAAADDEDYLWVEDQ
jgi:hypothetical protein